MRKLLTMLGLLAPVEHPFKPGDTVHLKCDRAHTDMTVQDTFVEEGKSAVAVVWVNSDGLIVTRKMFSAAFEKVSP